MPLRKDDGRDDDCDPRQMRARHRLKRVAAKHRFLSGGGEDEDGKGSQNRLPDGLERERRIKREFQAAKKSGEGCRHK